MKTCKTCNILKDFRSFYKHAKMKDGCLNICKDCKKTKQKTNRDSNIEYYQEYDRNRPNKVERAQKNAEYIKTEKGREVKEKATANYKTNYPIKYKATTAVNNAIRSKKLLKPTSCQYCKNTFTSRLLHGHHSDYLKQLEVIWLCNTCHNNWHLNNKPINGDKGLY